MAILNIIPTWLPSGSILEQTCKLLITNLGDQTLPANSLLKFTLGKYQTALPPATGFNDFSQKGNVVEAHLINAVLPKQTAILNLPIKLGSVLPFPPTLPLDFVMNNSPIHPINDTVAPTTPQNLQKITAGVNSLTLKWDPSSDNLGNIVYTVTYQQGPTGQVQKLTTELTQATLTGLAPRAEYQVSVVASDLSGNNSFPSFPLIVSTLPQLPVVSWGNFNPLPAVDTTSTLTPDLGDFLNQTNVKNYVLGFITGLAVPVNTKEGALTEVVPAFGGLEELVDSNTKITYPGDARISNYLKEAIEILRQKGGDVVLSFGGLNNLNPVNTLDNSALLNNLPMEAQITDVAKIVQNYQDILQNYNVQRLDFSFPQAFLSNQDAVARFVAAISQVMHSNPNLKTSYTLPVSGSPDLMGFNADSLNLLNLLANAGIQPSLVNLLPLNASNNFNSIKSAIEGVNDGNANHLGALQQLSAVYPGLSQNQAFKMLSVSPVFGQNSAGQAFNVVDQISLNAYALLHGLKLSGWNANNDLSGATGIAPGSFLKLLAELDPLSSQLPPLPSAAAAELVGNEAVESAN